MVVGMARALLEQRGMTAVLWGEVVVTVVYILNRSPTKALNGRTPYEAWHERKPAVSHQENFKACYINTKDQLADLLTKPLGRIKFLELCSRIGMVQLSYKTTHKT
jgi:hypothetical protein